MTRRTADAAPRLRVALVHDWLTGMRGGEKVLEALCELFPDAPLFTLVHVPGSVSARIEAPPHPRPRSSSGCRAPARSTATTCRSFPLAVEQFDLDGFDLVISSSHCAVKSVVVPGGRRHLCYCHSPMRYAWDQFDAYFGPAQVGAGAQPAAAAGAAPAGPVGRAPRRAASTAIWRILNMLRAGSADTIIAGRPSCIRPSIPPSTRLPEPRRTLSLSWSCLRSCPTSASMSPSRPAAASACRSRSSAGPGAGAARGAGRAGRGVPRLADRRTDARALSRRRRAVLLPGEEDFGIVPVEAQACGPPVVALGARRRARNRRRRRDRRPGRRTARRGVRRRRSSASLRTTFDRDAIRANAERFSRVSAFMTSSSRSDRDRSAAVARRDAPRRGRPRMR